MAVTLSVPLFAVTAVENFSNGFNARGTRGYNRGNQLYLILDWEFECTVVKFIVSSRNINCEICIQSYSDDLQRFLIY